MTTLKGIFPNPTPTRKKNFIHENVKNLRRMEQFFHTKEVEEFRKLQSQKKSSDRYRNVTSKINSTLSGGEKKVDSIERASLRRSDKNLSNPRIDKNMEQNGRIDPSPTKVNSHDTSTDISVRRRNNATESDKAARTLDRNVFDESRINCKTREIDDVKYRNRGIQTLDTKDMDSVYDEGVIRYPSAKIINKKYTMVGPSDRMNNNNKDDEEEDDDDDNDDDGGGDNDNNKDREESSHRKCASSLSDRGDGFAQGQPKRGSYDRTADTQRQLTSRDRINHVKLNKQKSAGMTVAGKMATQFNNNVPPANYRKGVVPKYIRDRKEAQQQQRQRDERMRAAGVHPDCPDGHVPLPNDERKETLRMLKKHHQEYVNELNMMPIKTDTLRSQKRKMEIEKQLTKLEEGIKVFSRPKVYVKVNA